MTFCKLSSPFLTTWNVADKTDEFDHHSILVASHEEVDARSTKTSHEEEYDTHSHVDGEDAKRSQYEIDSDTGSPEPEVGEDMHHGEEQHTGGGSLGADVRLQFHDLVGFSTHQSCWCGIVEGKPCDGEFQNLPKGDGAIA